MKNNNKIDVNGTSLQGYVKTTYGKIVEKLGKPTFEGSPDDKTTAEWHVANGKVVATIYDYKEGRTPKGEYEWHIGGHDESAVKLIKGFGIGKTSILRF